MRWQVGGSDAVLARVLAFFTLLLIVATWPIWWPSQSFPQVPFCALASKLPIACDFLVVVVLIVALMVACCQPDSVVIRRFALAAALLGGTILVILDQHRCQPWWYHFTLASLILITCRRQQAIHLLRFLLISVYAFSALSKFDYSFLHGNGTLFVRTALESVGIRPDDWSTHQLVLLAVLLPSTELAAAILLAVPRLRRCGMLLALAIHGMLLWLLGPWGLNHRWGVLIWNVAFICQVWILFGPAIGGGSSQPPSTGSARGDWSGRVPGDWKWPEAMAGLLVLSAIILPWGEPWGWWDPWLSWGLYSERAPKAELWIARPSVSSLPATLQPYLDDAHGNELWVRVAFDRWSLDATHAPLYPHDRFQLGVAIAVSRSLPKPQRWVLLERRGIPSRWDGRSSTQQYENFASLLTLSKQFVFNAQPRGTWNAATSQR